MGKDIVSDLGFSDENVSSVEDYKQSMIPNKITTNIPLVILERLVNNLAFMAYYAHKSGDSIVATRSDLNDREVFKNVLAMFITHNADGSLTLNIATEGTYKKSIGIRSVNLGIVTDFKYMANIAEITNTFDHCFRLKLEGD